MRKRDWAQKKINKDSHRDISLTTNRQKPKEGLGVKKSRNGYCSIFGIKFQIGIKKNSIISAFYENANFCVPVCALLIKSRSQLNFCQIFDSFFFLWKQDCSRLLKVRRNQFKTFFLPNNVRFHNQQHTLLSILRLNIFARNNYSG